MPVPSSPNVWCRNDTWAVSSSPSRHCSQLASTRNLSPRRSSSGTSVNGISGGRAGWCCRRAHIDPDHAAQLVGRIRLDADAFLEVAVGRLAGHVDALAGGVELPAVVDAAQAALLVATEEQRRAAVRTERADHADLAVGVAEGDQVFAQGARANRVAVRLAAARPRAAPAARNAARTRPSASPARPA